MKRLVIEVKDEGGDSSWKERYDPSDLVDPDAVGGRKGDRIRVRSEKGAQVWAEQLVAAFNRTRRPGEKARVLVSASFEQEGIEL